MLAVTAKLIVVPLKLALSHPSVELATGVGIAHPDGVSTANEPMPLAGPSVATDAGLKL